VESNEAEKKIGAEKRKREEDENDNGDEQEEDEEDDLELKLPYSRVSKSCKGAGCFVFFCFYSFFFRCERFCCKTKN
jgi:hypothetical protein